MEPWAADQNRIIDYQKEYRYQVYASETEKKRLLFSESSIATMQKAITFFLQGVHPEGKNIVVPRSTIVSVADSFYETTPAHLDVLQRMVVNFIVAQVKEEYETVTKNNKLSIWVTKYDVESGMQQFNDVKLNNKKRAPYSYYSY